MDGIGKLFIDSENGVCVFQFFIGASGDGFEDGGANISAVVDFSSEFAQACVEFGDTDGGGSHVYTAMSCSEVEGYADDSYFAIGHGIIYFG